MDRSLMGNMSRIISFFFSGETWRALRKMLSPTFTTGKLKFMLHPIEGIADSTVAFIEKKAKENPEMDFKPIIQGFALDR